MPPLPPAAPAPPPSGLSADLAADVAVRVAARIATARRRREERDAWQADHRRRREYGNRARHAQKLARLTTGTSAAAKAAPTDMETSR